jgi:hypothetical protein
LGALTEKRNQPSSAACFGKKQAAAPYGFDYFELSINCIGRKPKRIKENKRRHRKARKPKVLSNRYPLIDYSQ